MRKKYNVRRAMVGEENIPFREKMERKKNGEIFQKQVRMNGMEPDTFLEFLFGVDTFYFFPKGKSGEDAMRFNLQLAVEHSLSVLQDAKDEVDEELYTWLRSLLNTLVQLMDTKAWNENSLLSEELLPFNSYVKSIPSAPIETTVYESPLIVENFDFYVDGDNVVTKLGVDCSRIEKCGSLILFEEPGLSKKEKVECALDIIDQYMNTFKHRKSYQNKDINHEMGEMDNKMHEEAMVSGKAINRVLQYIVNTTSWRSNELFGFDEFELKLKSKNIPFNAGYIEYYEENRETVK